MDTLFKASTRVWAEVASMNSLRLDSTKDGSCAAGLWTDACRKAVAGCSFCCTGAGDDEKTPETKETAELHIQDMKELCCGATAGVSLLASSTEAAAAVVLSATAAVVS